jgi:peptide-methionine (R)-S-oxide reductase
MDELIKKTEREWRELLTDEQYHVTRERGTEPPFTGAYWKTKSPGTYQCICCGQSLFDAETKFDSGTGWPSFWAPLEASNVEMEVDNSYGMRRTEVMCKRCHAHLGHLFPDGPAPTGLRFCINSASLKLVEPEQKK